ncbi:septum formation initiator family protein [Heliomicrobium modesticaldum Ice1]|uniref:Septum formation initiator family protein n=1 Tax=Heliobacterium modesticaldum (strain ATCC 51547 / Ice1) TaxID=498761 RepID=B0TBK4_HELMI|nr:septum formation initiator family protein [Heliomicrobium modesticaldum Ice1]
MPPQQQRQPLRRPRKGSGMGMKWAMVAAVIVAFALAALPPFLQQRQLARESDRLSAELEQVRAERRQLEKEKEWLASDAYVEQVARQQLGLVKPGEMMVVRTRPGNALKKDTQHAQEIRD